MAPDLGTRGHNFKIQVQHCNTEVRRRFFSNRVVNQWNGLGENTVNADTLNKFKALLHNDLNESLFDYYE